MYSFQLCICGGFMDLLLLFFSAFAVCVIIIPILIYICRKYNLFDKHNKRKIHNGNVSRIGGVAIFFGFVIPFIIDFKLENFNFNIYLYLAGMAVAFLTGLVDDFKNLRARYKLLLQILAGLLVSLSGLAIHELNFFNIITIPTGIFSHVITIGLVLVFVNAVNLIDGMDGLAAGLVLIANIFILVLAVLTGNTHIALMVIIISGSILGFYLFNFHHAKIFMGDSGAYLLGFIYATLPLMERNAGQIFPPFFLLALMILVVPAADILNVIFIRVKSGVWIFSPDKNHIHHRLMRLGFSQKGVLYILYSYTVMMGLWAILFMFIPSAFYILLITANVAMNICAMYSVFWAEKESELTSYARVSRGDRYQAEH